MLGSKQQVCNAQTVNLPPRLLGMKVYCGVPNGDAANTGSQFVHEQVFDTLASNPHAATDTKAWNALAAVHASQGVMRDAELAAARATEVAASQVCWPGGDLHGHSHLLSGHDH